MNDTLPYMDYLGGHSPFALVNFSDFLYSTTCDQFKITSTLGKKQRNQQIPKEKHIIASYW